MWDSLKWCYGYIVKGLMRGSSQGSCTSCPSSVWHWRWGYKTCFSSTSLKSSQWNRWAELWASNHIHTSCSEIALYPGWFPLSVKRLQKRVSYLVGRAYHLLVLFSHCLFILQKRKGIKVYSSLSFSPRLYSARICHQVGCRDELTFSWTITPVCLLYNVFILSLSHYQKVSWIVIFSLCTLLCCTGGDRGGFFESGSLQPTWRKTTLDSNCCPVSMCMCITLVDLHNVHVSLG